MRFFTGCHFKRSEKFCAPRVFAEPEDPSLRFGMTAVGFTAKFDEMGY